MDFLSWLPNAVDGAPLVEFPCVGTLMLCPPTNFSLPEAQADWGDNPAGARSVREPETGIELDPHGPEAVPSSLESCAELRTVGTEPFGADQVPELGSR